MRYRFLLILVAFAWVGCGDDDTPSVPTDAGPRPDRGPGFDAGPDVDGSIPEDGDVPTDGFIGIDGGPPPECSFTFDPSTDLIRLGLDPTTGERTLAVSASTVGYAVAWNESALGIPDVYARLIPPEGAPGRRVQITDNPALARSPALATSGSSFLIAWYDNRSGGFEVYTKALDSALDTTAGPHRLTMNDVRDDSPALLTLGSTVLASWVEDDMLASTRIATTRALSTDGSPSGSARAATSPPQSPTSPVLGAASGGAAMVWARSVRGDADVLLQRLSTDGAPTGDPIVLNTENNADGTVDLAMTEGGGAVAFGVSVAASRQEVRFQGVDGMGSRVSEERILTVAPETGRDASIDGFRGGYLVAYRALMGEGISEPQLRVAIVDAIGNVLDTFDIAGIAPSGGRTTIRVAPDGRSFLVAWADAQETDSLLRAVRVRCE